jgi:hypothetical protein
MAQPVAALSALVVLRTLLSDAMRSAAGGVAARAAVASPDLVEIAMQHPSRRPGRPHRQLALDLMSGPAAMLDTPPAWRTLPDPIQRTLTDLLIHLLIAHARGFVPELDAQPEGAADER